MQVYQEKESKMRGREKIAHDEEEDEGEGMRLL